MLIRLKWLSHNVSNSANLLKNSSRCSLNLLSILYLLSQIVPLPLFIFCGHSFISLNLFLRMLWLLVLKSVFFCFGRGASLAYVIIVSSASVSTAITKSLEAFQAILENSLQVLEMIYFLELDLLHMQVALCLSPCPSVSVQFS